MSARLVQVTRGRTGGLHMVPEQLAAQEVALSLPDVWLDETEQRHEAWMRGTTAATIASRTAKRVYQATHFGNGNAR